MLKRGIPTQTALAKKIGISKNQLSVMLSAKFCPIKSNVAKLCNVLGIEATEIIQPNTPASTKQQMTGVDSMHHRSHGRVRAIELFAGAGGLALGLEQAGIETTLFVEIDKH